MDSFAMGRSPVARRHANNSAELLFENGPFWPLSPCLSGLSIPEIQNHLDVGSIRPWTSIR